MSDHMSEIHSAALSANGLAIQKMYAVVGIPAKIVAQRNMLLSSAFLLRIVSTVPETPPALLIPEIVPNGQLRNKFKSSKLARIYHILKLSNDAPFPNKHTPQF
ncbi:hypothetical protein CEXT_63631 [Caerostris extrusa]|uniref:Uncharacterized protein n=1 Tax=Caerostris extrusa TaxID=172846 RepID=A0AAV4ME72_CAEEX|nr:hypothetical protein CEXT_63631 [Caerostris extrusa]